MRAMDIFEDNSPTDIIFILKKKNKMGNNDTLDRGKKK